MTQLAKPGRGFLMEPGNWGWRMGAVQGRERGKGIKGGGEGKRRTPGGGGTMNSGTSLRNGCTWGVFRALTTSS